MNIKRKINGYIITVKKWSSDIIITNTITKETKTITAQDHIKAVLMAKAL